MALCAFLAVTRLIFNLAIKLSVHFSWITAWWYIFKSEQIYVSLLCEILLALCVCVCVCTCVHVSTLKGNGLSYWHQPWYTYTIWQFLGMHWPKGQNSKGQGHTIMKIPMVTWLLVKCAAVADVLLFCCRYGTGTQIDIFRLSCV